MKLAGLTVDLVDNAGQRLAGLVDEGDLRLQAGLLVIQSGELLADACLVRAEVMGISCSFREVSWLLLVVMEASIALRCF